MNMRYCVSVVSYMEDKHNYYHYGEDETGWCVHLPPYRLTVSTIEGSTLLEKFDMENNYFNEIQKLDSIIHIDSEENLRNRLKTLLIYL